MTTLVDIEHEVDLIDQELYLRRVAGLQKYGPLAFVKRNTMQDIEEELLDFINYGYLLLIKIRRFREDLRRIECT